MKEFLIKHRFTGAVLYTGAGQSLRDVVVAAVAARAYLADAYLADANLADANLADADLELARRVPDGVEKKDPPEPYNRDESLERRAQRYRERHPEIPVVEKLDLKILQLVDSGSGKLDMSQWHSCETTHCRAGWAITLAGPEGKKLEEKYGPRHAGAMIYRASTGRSPYFYASNDDALADIKKCAAEQLAEQAPQP